MTVSKNLAVSFPGWFPGERNGISERGGGEGRNFRHVRE